MTLGGRAPNCSTLSHLNRASDSVLRISVLSLSIVLVLMSFAEPERSTSDTTTERSLFVTRMLSMSCILCRTGSCHMWASLTTLSASAEDDEDVEVEEESVAVEDDAKTAPI